MSARQSENSASLESVVMCLLFLALLPIEHLGTQGTGGALDRLKF